MGAAWGGEIIRRSYFVVVCLSIFMTGSATAQTNAAQPTPADAERIISSRAKQAILALKSRDQVKLAELVHPRKGLRFSPYQSVTLGKHGDLVFSRVQVKTLLTNSKRYLWGEEDGSGDPIRLTFAAYLRTYVYDHDYSKAKDVAFNGEHLSQGTLINNLRETYPSAIIVEYHFPGFEEKYGGMDWKSLWLVFEKQGTRWYLVGIAHGEWTI
jgi:hypothetical protein